MIACLVAALPVVTSLSTPIVDDETLAIIEKILQDNCLELDELMEWTGCEFTADEPEYLPLLGKSYTFFMFFFSVYITMS
jgi:hypothetical protein